MFGPTFASFDDFALRIDRIHDAGGVVVFEGRVTGLTKADGRPDAPTAWLWTVRTRASSTTTTMTWNSSRNRDHLVM